MITKMITVNPDKRYSARELLGHPWLLEGADLLSARDLAATQLELRRFNARRRFKMAIHTVLAANRLRESVYVPRDDAIEMAIAGDFAPAKASHNTEKEPTLGNDVPGSSSTVVEVAAH